MKVEYYACNHCGKKLDEHKDRCDTYLDVPIIGVLYVDLCESCANELADIILEYLRIG